MAGSRVPAALRNRLEDDATFGLIELLDRERKDWSEQVLSVAADRFERQLSEELSGLRVEFRTVRTAVKPSCSTEVHEGVNSLRQEIATTRVEMLKWPFLFWIGQVAAMAGLVAIAFKLTVR